MRGLPIRVISIALAAAACLLADVAGAVVTSASVNPASASVPGATSSAVVLTWQATSAPDASGAGGGGTLVSSPDGVFRAGGPSGTVIGMSSQPISAIAQGPAGQPATATFAETVVVPLPVLAQAAQLGATRIVYQRAFNDGQLRSTGDNVAEVTLNLTVSLSVAVNPASANVSSGQASTVSMTWQISGGGASVSSTEGVFLAGGPNGEVLGTNARPLTGATRAIGGTNAALLPETVQIPTRVVLRAEQIGVTRIAYRRAFTSPGAEPGIGAAMLEIAGPQGGPFSISRVDLRFGAGSRQIVVSRDDTTYAYADITHVGTGRLEAQWEVAEPASTRGVPFFRTLSLVRRQLVGAGARTTVRSPVLPASADGVYLVRLRITSPDTPFAPPTLRYVVNPADIGITPERIAVTAPSPGAVHSPATRFAWESLPGAVTYRVELHAAPAEAAIAAPAVPGGATSAAETEIGETEIGEPASGIAVDGATADTALSGLALSHLAPGRFYVWRVVAYDGSGRLIGRSELRRLYVPEADEGG